MSLKIAEIFPSIQGEGFRQGYPAVFIRLFGCSVRCQFCDTKDSWGGTGFGSCPQASTNEEIINTVKHWITKYPNIRDIVITGGEPFEQFAGLYELVRAIKQETLLKRRQITIETSGTLNVQELRPADKGSFIDILNTTGICLSPKPNKKSDPLFYQYGLSYKLLVDKHGIITPDTPQKIIELGGDPGPDNRYLFLQPVEWGTDNDVMEARKKVVELAMEYGCRVSAQIHKILGCK